MPNAQQDQRFADNPLVQHDPEPSAAIATLYDTIDLDYLKADLPDLFVSMRNGVNRIKNIVKALQTFSRTDNVGVKPVDIQDNLESVLTMVAQSLQAQQITVERDYSPLPTVEINPGEFNQALMHIVVNAIDAFDGVERDDRTLRITTTREADRVRIAIADNGKGMTPAVQGEYQVALFQGEARVESVVFPELKLTAEQVFRAGRSQSET